MVHIIVKLLQKRVHRPEECEDLSCEFKVLIPKSFACLSYAKDMGVVLSESSMKILHGNMTYRILLKSLENTDSKMLKIVTSLALSLLIFLEKTFFLEKSLKYTFIFIYPSFAHKK